MPPDDDEDDADDEGNADEPEFDRKRVNQIVAPARTLLRISGYLILAALLLNLAATCLESRLFGSLLYVIGTIVGTALQFTLATVMFQGARNLQLRSGQSRVVTACVVTFVVAALLLVVWLLPLWHLVLNLLNGDRYDVDAFINLTALISLVVGMFSLVAGIATLRAVGHPEMRGFYVSSRHRQSLR